MRRTMRTITLILLLTAIAAYAGESSVTTSDGNTITGITVVARTGDSYVGIRYPGGLMQVEIAKLPDSFLKSWGITREQSKEEPEQEQTEHQSETYELVKKQYLDSAIGEVVEYSLILVPETHMLDFDGMSTEKRGKSESAGLWVHLQFREERLDEMLRVIERYNVLLNTGSRKAELLGTVGANVFYFAPAGVMTGSQRPTAEDEIGMLMRITKADGLAPIPYLAADEIEMLRGFLVRYKSGEFKALIKD